MKTIMHSAIIAVALLAAAPAIAQSNTAGRGGEAAVGGGGGFGGGGGTGGGNGRLDRQAVACIAQRCGPRREFRSLTHRPNGDRCGQQLTFGRDAIFYYERCDRRL